MVITTYFIKMKVKSLSKNTSQKVSSLQIEMNIKIMIANNLLECLLRSTHRKYSSDLLVEKRHKQVSSRK